MITGFSVPAGPWTRRSLYLKIRDRQSYEFALASAAVALDLAGPDRARGAHRPGRRGVQALAFARGRSGAERQVARRALRAARRPRRLSRRRGPTARTTSSPSSAGAPWFAPCSRPPSWRCDMAEELISTQGMIGRPTERIDGRGEGDRPGALRLGLRPARRGLCGAGHQPNRARPDRGHRRAARPRGSGRPRHPDLQDRRRADPAGQDVRPARLHGHDHRTAAVGSDRARRPDRRPRGRRHPGGRRGGRGRARRRLRRGAGVRDLRQPRARDRPGRQDLRSGGIRGPQGRRRGPGVRRGAGQGRPALFDADPAPQSDRAVLRRSATGRTAS